VAARTLGFSGASLANLLNEAAILAARRNLTFISYSEIDEALDRLTLGLLRPTAGGGAEARQRLMACHEAGHAVMGLLCDGYDSVSKVTIVPRGGKAGGLTLFTPLPDRIESGLYSLRHLKHRLAVALGGTVAEELFFTEEGVTTGGADDLQHVRSLARRMVAQWGFAFHALGGGPVAWEGEDGNGPFSSGAASADTEAEIDAQVTRLVDAAYAVCRAALTEHRALLEEVAEALVQEETLDAARIAQISKPHLRPSKASRIFGGRKTADRPWATAWPKPSARSPREVREPARVRRDKDGKAIVEEAFGI
jgi:cell division protease FtsH